MKGFGDSFAQSFDREQKIAANEREDTFRLTYQEFVRKREKVEEQKKEDTKLATRAKSIVESYGQVPEEAWTKVYGWLQSGVDDATIKTNLERGTWKVKQSGGEKQAVNENTAATPDPMGVEAQTEAAIPNEEKTAGNPISGFIDRIRQNRSQKNNTYALEKIAANTGLSIEEVQAQMGASTNPMEVDASSIDFTPGTAPAEPDQFASLDKAMVEQAQAKTAAENKPTPENLERARVADERVKALKQSEMISANRKLGIPDGTGFLSTVRKKDGSVDITQATDNGDGTFSNPNGEPIDGVVQPMSQEMKEDFQKISTSLKEPLSQLNPKRNNAKAAVRAFNSMNDLVESTNGEVLAPVTTGVLQGAQKWITDGITAAKQIQQIAGTKNGVLPENGAQYLEEVRDRLLSEGGDDLATKRGLFETNRALMAYYLAGSVEQGGKALAEGERKLFTEMASGGVTVDKFAGAMSDILMNNIRNIDSEGKSIYENNQDVKNFKEFYDIKDVPSVAYNSLENELANTDDVDLRKAYSVLSKNDPRTAPDFSPGDPKVEEAAVKEYPTPPSGAVEMLTRDPSLAAQFDQKYGAGAAKRVLGGK